MLNEDIFTCMICSNIFIKPVYCKSCKNSFCNECYNDLVKYNNNHNKDVLCPLCKNFLEVEPNIEMENMIKNMKVICKKCNLSFNSFEEYANHNIYCKKLICKICNLQFDNIIFFIEHFENLELHLNIVAYLFDSNNNENWSLIYANDIAKLNKKNNNNLSLKDFKNKEYVNFLDIKQESNFDSVYEEYKKNKMPFKEFSKTDFFKSKCEKVGKDFINQENREIKKLENIPPKCKYYKKYDLFYCFEKTNIDCNCCPDHICKPGNCMCKDCMTINLKLHRLKPYYSINKEKRACKYTNKSFRCHSKYIKITEKENGNKIINESFCHGEFPPCPACQETTKIMEYYIKPELIEKLKSFD